MDWCRSKQEEANLAPAKERQWRQRGRGLQLQASWWSSQPAAGWPDEHMQWTALYSAPVFQDCVLWQAGQHARAPASCAGLNRADRAHLDPLQRPCSAWQPQALCGPPSPGLPLPAAACACRRGPRYIRHADRVHRGGQAARSAALGAQRFPLPCSQVALRSSALAGLRLEQHGVAAKAQRRAAVVVAAAEGETQQLDPLERRAAAGWVPV